VFDSWADFLFIRLDDHLSYCLEINAVSRQECTRIQLAFERLASLCHGVEPVLLHGDPGSHNVFTDGTRIKAVLDWEDCLAGDPVFDLAFWATFHPNARHPAVFDGYRSVQPLPQDFEARFWLYFLRIALSKTVLRHRFGYPDRPGRPPASLRIQNALARVESLIPGFSGVAEPLPNPLEASPAIVAPLTPQPVAAPTRRADVPHQAPQPNVARPRRRTREPSE
jgi:hypothetical protein